MQLSFCNLNIPLCVIFLFPDLNFLHDSASAIVRVITFLISFRRLLNYSCVSPLTCADENFGSPDEMLIRN